MAPEHASALFYRCSLNRSEEAGREPAAGREGEPSVPDSCIGDGCRSCDTAGRERGQGFVDECGRGTEAEAY
ncbi:hypothetical protein [Pelodictyon luteolum]|nr:hypothetical protein [Pelodictyon luteolum]